MKLEINSRRNYKNYLNTYILNNILINEHGPLKKLVEKFFKNLELKDKIEIQHTRTYGKQKNSIKRKDESQHQSKTIKKQKRQ